jgi:hypothetical protein
MNNLIIKISEPQKMLLNCLLYNELMMLEDRLSWGDVEQREEIIQEVLDIKDMLAQIRGE